MGEIDDEVSSVGLFQSDLIHNAEIERTVRMVLPSLSVREPSDQWRQYHQRIPILPSDG